MRSEEEIKEMVAYLEGYIYAQEDEGKQLLAGARVKILKWVLDNTDNEEV